MYLYIYGSRVRNLGADKVRAMRKLKRWLVRTNSEEDSLGSSLWLMSSLHAYQLFYLSSCERRSYFLIIVLMLRRGLGCRSQGSANGSVESREQNHPHSRSTPSHSQSPRNVLLPLPLLMMRQTLSPPFVIPFHEIRISQNWNKVIEKEVFIYTLLVQSWK